jgi:predicted RNA binding protein YcfA (HicA-like mRNA interferase family)
LSGRLPVVSGDELISALGKLGRVVARQRGSHVRLRHPERAVPLVDPRHQELKRGTLAGILGDAVSTPTDSVACCEPRLMSAPAGASGVVVYAAAGGRAGQ